MRYLALSALALSIPAFAMLPNPTTTAPATSTSQSVAPAQSADFISAVNAFIVKSDNGREVLVPINVGTPVKSGDVLEYQGLFTNTGDRVRKMDVTLGIADGLELVGGVVPQHASASMDGQRFVRMPIRVNIGGQVQNLPLSQYKALRWTLEDIGLGGTAVVKYRAKLK